MSARLTELEFAELLSRRGMKTTSRKPIGPVKREATQQVENDYKAELLQQLGFVGIKVEPEFYFARPRKFRADYRVIGSRVLIEYEGGLFNKGRAGVSHAGVNSILGDMEKTNIAQLGGWIQIRIAPNHVVSGQALQWIEAAVELAQTEK